MKKKTKRLIGVAFVCALILALGLVVAFVIVPHFTNKFRIDVVDDIALGASKADVSAKLGDPDLVEMTRWGYGDSELCSYVEDAQDISAAMEEALFRGDLERAERLNRQYENLLNEVASKKFSYIEILFEDNAVVSVLLDKAYALEPGYKKVEEDKLTWSGGKSVVLPYYIDYTQNPEGEMRELDCELGDDVECYNGKDLSCATTFTDGSYYQAYVKSFSIEDRYIVWTDEYSNHKAYKPNNFQTSVTALGTVSEDGVWHSNVRFKSITIPANVTSIGGGAFSNCTGLTSIAIPDSVTSIGDSAFEDCSGLTSIDIPGSVTTIGRSAFRGCSGLKSVTIGSGVTAIGVNAFYGCIGLTGELKIPDSVTSIGGGAFSYCSGLTSVMIGSGVTSIGNETFEGCSGLTSIVIPDGVTSIGAEAFMECRGLMSITIGRGMTSIGNNAFICCYKLIEVWNHSALPIKRGSTGYGDVGHFAKHVYNGQEKGIQTVTEEGYIFYEEGDEHYLLGCCGDQTKLSLPEKSPLGYDYAIYQHAFSGCSGLTSITIPDSVTSIGRYAFEYCRGLESVTIGSGVTSIGRYAFEYCRGLESVTIGSGVTSIGDSAFRGCSGLTSIEIPDSVTSIGSDAFRGCSGLTSVTIPESVTSIGDYAFSDCSGLTSVTIGSGMTSIRDSAFRGCSKLTSITIPHSVTSIENWAFSGCSGLKTVYYQGTAEEWRRIYIDDYNSNLTSATLYYFTEDAPTEEEWQESEYWWHFDETTGEVVEWLKPQA